MLRLNLEEITEADLESLCKNQAGESISLEFKRELNLDSKADKAEAAKDVSAMANTAGGRIVYGIEEAETPDGANVASKLCPLSSADVGSRIEDVLISSIHPRPRFRTRVVPVGAGQILIVEVYPAYSSDLYMVTGFKENRFYRRGEQRTILMTEPEIREAYGRIAAKQLAVDATLEQAVATETGLVRHLQESVIVVPWFGRRDLVDPRILGASLGEQFKNGPLHRTSWEPFGYYLRVVSDGYRGYQQSDGPLNACAEYAAILRAGLIHFAVRRIKSPSGTTGKLSAIHSLDLIVAALSVSKFILEKAAYWGPVRVIHQFRTGWPFHVIDPTRGQDWELLSGRKPIETGSYCHVVGELNFKEFGGSVRHVIRELLDQIFQTNGDERCPWFDVAGNLRAGMERYIPADLLARLA